jgi:hypothetical protein
MRVRCGCGRRCDSRPSDAAGPPSPLRRTGPRACRDSGRGRRFPGGYGVDHRPCWPTRSRGRSHVDARSPRRTAGQRQSTPTTAGPVRAAAWRAELNVVLVGATTAAHPHAGAFVGRSGRVGVLTGVGSRYDGTSRGRGGAIKPDVMAADGREEAAAGSRPRSRRAPRSGGLGGCLAASRAWARRRGRRDLPGASE